MSRVTNTRVANKVGRYEDQGFSPDVSQILTGRDLNLCLVEVRKALLDPSYTPQQGACALEPPVETVLPGECPDGSCALRDLATTRERFGV